MKLPLSVLLAALAVSLTAFAQDAKLMPNRCAANSGLGEMRRSPPGTDGARASPIRAARATRN